MDEVLGSAIPAHCSKPTMRGRQPQKRRPAIREIRKGHLHLQRVCVLSGAAGRRSRRIPVVRQYDQPCKEPEALGEELTGVFLYSLQVQIDAQAGFVRNGKITVGVQFPGSFDDVIDEWGAGQVFN